MGLPSNLHRCLRALGLIVTVLALLGASGFSAAGRLQTPESGKKVSDLKIAFFESGSNNSYVQARMQAAEEWAAEHGASIQIFDPNWDPTTQFNQMQTALQSGRFNGYVMTSVVPGPLCNLVRDAVKNGELIAVMNQPQCGRETESGEALREPGTVTFVGGQTLDVYTEWMEFIAEQNPDGGKVAIITGPPTDANAKNLELAFENVLADKGFEMVAQQGTDYSTPEGFAAAQDIIQANPDLDIIMANWSGLTQGIVQAVKASGREGLKIYDMGGNTWALEAVKNGDIESTVMFLPIQEATRALDAVAAAYMGEEVPAFINLAEDPSLPNGSPFVTKENVDQYEAQY